MALPHDQSDLSRIYAQRFQDNLEYRKHIWRVLITSFFQKYIPKKGSVLDLGCGYGEFINQVTAGSKRAMDMNPDAAGHLADGVAFLQQDCSRPWPIEPESLDTVFTSNFFEHLPDKGALGRTLDQIHTALKPGGCLIAMGPNIRCTRGAYWDFWDHYVPLTEKSLGEALCNRGFHLARCTARFLPYTMAGKRPTPLIFVRAYLFLEPIWPLFEQQFLVVAEKRLPLGR